MSIPPRIAVIGGGAAGFFGAIRAAETDPAAQVTILEATDHPLAKVRVSGGGRCNTTHACFEPRELVQRYPRGSRELIGPFSRFGPRETIAWFAARGVELKTEPDGRMFPVTDDSATIVDCLQHAAMTAGVRLRTRTGVAAITRASDGTFALTLRDGATMHADRVLLAVGGSKGAGGAALAQALGHTIEPQVPSLFTFHIDDPLLKGLEGLAAPTASVQIVGSKLRAEGPVLVTHWGLSGPAILRLSAWGARDLHDAGYTFTLVLNWSAAHTTAQAAAALAEQRTAQARKQVVSINPYGLPARLWERLVAAAGVPAGATWAGLSKAHADRLASQVTATRLAVSGKSMNKEEFVTCGGVRLREVDFRTMESRVCPGLFFAGEVLDIDGITGGFNFQAAWTTGWLAGSALAS
jgi:predicted Rossmann fold flavoprotein